jgi:hypothetical protein
LAHCCPRKRQGESGDNSDADLLFARESESRQTTRPENAAGEELRFRRDAEKRGHREEERVHDAGVVREDEMARTRYEERRGDDHASESQSLERGQECAAAAKRQKRRQDRRNPISE